MALHIANISSDTVNVCLAIHDPGCSARNWPWRKVAWYVIGPGGTLIPNVLSADLRTVNGVMALYAFNAPRSKEWQGTGNNWYTVSDGRWLNQCLGDDANCTRTVNFVPVSFGGNAHFITYLGPEANQVRSQASSISVTPGRGAFYISGRGFAPGSTVNVIYNYFHPGGVTSNSGAPSVPHVDSSGNFATIVYVSTLFYPGRLDVQVADRTFSGLSATVSVPVA